MRPIQFRGNNGILKAPEGNPNVKDLPVLTDGSCVISCWELTAEERKRVMETGVVYLCVEGASHPPLFLSGLREGVLVDEEGDGYAIDLSEKNDDE